MQELRRIPFLIAALLLLCAVLAELGSQALLGATAATSARMGELVDEQLAGMEGADEVDRDELLADMKRLNKESEPPGIAIGYLALLDGLLLFSIVLLVLGLFVPEGLHGKTQGCISLIFSIVMLIATIVLLFVALFLLLQMVAMFLAVPFGTLAYLAIWGFFDRGGASVALSLIMLLKLGFAVLLTVAHPRFLASKGLVLMILTSLLANVIISFLHGFVPIILVSITDAIAALVVAILAIIWGIAMLVMSIPAIVKAVT